PQLDWPAAETMASFWAGVISPALTKLLEVWATQETYLPWFFQGPAHGQSWAIEQPLASTVSPEAVPGQLSWLLRTPSWSLSCWKTMPQGAGPAAKVDVIVFDAASITEIELLLPFVT